MNTTPHTHYCGKCDQHRDCEAARNGGCIFPSTSAVTCNECAERQYPLGPAPAWLRGEGSVIAYYEVPTGVLAITTHLHREAGYLARLRILGDLWAGKLGCWIAPADLIAGRRGP